MAGIEAFEPDAHFLHRTRNYAGAAKEEVSDVRVRVMRDHTDSVQSCQFINDDSQMLTSSWDKTLKLWDFESGQVLRTYGGGHSMYISQARASNNATRLVSAGWDKKVNLWDTETGTILWQGEHDGMVTCCNFSHDGKYVVSGSDLDFTVKVWEVDTGKLVHCISDLHTSTITSCSFGPKDDRIYTTSMDKTTKFYDLHSEQNTITLSGHINIISAACCTSDERKLATVSWDKCINIWDISTGMYRSEGPSSFQKAHEGSISCCNFSPDGLMLTTGGYDMCVMVWDTENMVEKLKLYGHAGYVNDVCFSRDQHWVLSCARDQTLRLWNIEMSDRIPAVLENRKSIGLQMYKCSECGKPFSMAQTDSQKDSHLCVFCRLSAPAVPPSITTASEL